MIWYCALYFLIILNGANSIQFIIETEDGVACIVEFASQNEEENQSQLMGKRCVTLEAYHLWDFNYHFTQQHIYYIDGGMDEITLVRIPLSFSLERTTTNIYNKTTNFVRRFVLDWIHNKFYIINGNISLSNSLQSDHDILIEDIITQPDLIALCNRTKMYIMDLQIDPYNQLLFILASTVHLDDTDIPDKIYIISSDLKGNGLKIILQRQFLVGYVCFFVDVSEMRIYIINLNRLFKYDYNGNLLNTLRLPKTPSQISVLEDKLYLYSHLEILLYEVDLNPFNFIQDNFTNHVPQQYVTAVYQPQMDFEDIRFKVLDIRLQRQKRSGKFLCDRTDCPYLCEVRPSGDTCVCRETDAKDRDGVTCYTCGQSNLTSSSHLPAIVNGNVSHPSNFPWHAVLYFTNSREAFCGGTLITSNVVLTAAHCVTSSNYVGRSPPIQITALMVALGKTYRTWEHNEPTTIRTNVTRIIVHNEYLGPSMYYAHDIALLYLDTKVKSNNYVMPACLDYNLNQLPTDTNFTGYIAGFGYTAECGGQCSKQSEVLLYKTAPVMSFSDCYRSLITIDSATYHGITSDKICIGNGSVSAVQKGDSGGGLTLAYRGLHYVVGVVSEKLIRKVGEKYKYSFGAFTNVNEHIEWIKQNIPEGT